jgi:hypothetical protein
MRQEREGEMGTCLARHSACASEPFQRDRELGLRAGGRPCRKGTHDCAAGPGTAAGKSRNPVPTVPSASVSRRS